MKKYCVLSKEPVKKYFFNEDATDLSYTRLHKHHVIIFNFFIHIGFSSLSHHSSIGCKCWGHN